MNEDSHLSELLLIHFLFLSMLFRNDRLVLLFTYVSKSAGCPYSCVNRAPYAFQFSSATGTARATSQGGYASPYYCDQVQTA